MCGFVHGLVVCLSRGRSRSGLENVYRWNPKSVQAVIWKECLFNLGSRNLVSDALAVHVRGRSKFAQILK